MDTTRRRASIALMAFAVAMALVVPATPPARAAADAALDVIVRSEAGAGAAAAAVRAVGGEVEQSLDVIGGVAATIPSSAEAELIDDGLQVTLDASVEVLGKGGGSAPGGAFTLRDTVAVTGAVDYWSEGITGAGVGVALIDTGVSPVEGLDDPGQLYQGPDLSFESQNDAIRHLDTFGHGTHMAGIIAGRDTGASAATASSDPDAFLGVAPDAHVVSLKVADALGTTDVSQVIAAIDWVVANRSQRNIRVLNLSFGVYSGNPASTDPLAHAAEAAWDAGIVVVAAAGNDGNTTTGLTSPAYSPRVIAVGAVDTKGSTRYSHWTPLNFSARGDGVRNPDILAPGASIASLRVPGSYLDANHGQTARVDDRLFKGSGTSQAAAVVSGAAALVLQDHPTWTPDQVKEALLDESNGLRNGAGFSDRTGRRALRLEELDRATPTGGQNASPTATGGGSLELARGGYNVELDGTPLTGEVDIFGNPVDTTALAAAQREGTAFVDGRWNGAQWSGAQWSGAQWAGAQWTGTTWTGAQWSATHWSGAQWKGAQWSGAQWTGAQWKGAQWKGTTWTSAAWG